MSILTPSPNPVRARSSGRNEASWQAEMRAAIRDPDELCRALGLDEQSASQSAAASFAVFVPPGYLSRIRPGDPRDPLLLQVLPTAGETAAAEGFSADPVEDAAAALAPGLLQKYAGRALMVVTGACAVHCRYCFRRHFPYGEGPQSDAAWTPALEAIAGDATIREVILSGGDPLTLTDHRLSRLVERVAEISHVKRLRVHTRLPIMIPSRVTREMLAWLGRGRLTSVVVVHANHAQEIDDDVAASLARLRGAGATVLNQTVLLRGVNDSIDAQCTLSERLVEVGTTPYYLHQLDRVQGAAHFEVAEEVGMAIIEEMRRRLPGYMVPRYVRETPGEPHKSVLS